MVSKTPIGFIGLGNMGMPMAERLIDAGQPLLVWGRGRDRLQPILDRGAELAASPAEIAKACDVVVLCVLNTEAVESVVFGPDGIAQSATPDKILIDSSTIDPVSSVAFATRLKDETGMAWVDMPVSGGAPAAREGRLTLMAGGTEEDVARVRPLVEPYCGRFTHVGPSGAGQAAKACNQLIIGGTIALVSEAFRLAKGMGIDPHIIPDALKDGWADSAVLQVHGRRMADNEHWPRDEQTWEPYDGSGNRNPPPPLMMVKDMTIADEMGRSLETVLPVTTLVTQMYRMALEQGHGQGGQIAIARLFETNPHDK